MPLLPPVYKIPLYSNPFYSSLERQLASSELYREGDKVRDTMKAFQAAKASLKQLYEHWEEAVELN